MLRAGICMADIDRTDLAMYLKVMAHAAEHDEDTREKGADRKNGKEKQQVIELKRGYIDDFF